MAQEIHMPKLSDTMTEGTVSKWYKKVGDAIKEGDIIADIETDKATQEFESEHSGTLLYVGTKEGEAIGVNELIAIIGDEKEDITHLISTQKKEEIQENLQKTQIEEAESELGIKSEKIEVNSDRIFISPLAKKMALEKGIEVNKISGSGDGGRIVAKDIENLKQNNSTPIFASTEIQNFEDTILPMGSIKKVAAKRLSESKFTAPHYYLTMGFDMDQIMQLREEINKTIVPNKVSFNDILIKFVAMTIKKHPQVNVSWVEDKIIQHNNINIGVAVAIDEGLLVPVINYADQKSFETISNEVKDKAKRSRERKIKVEELSGSTFSISNLGSYGIESFTSIINQPNACILSVGAIVQKPVVKNNQIVVGNTMKVTLACDHRTVDGATGSAFLQTLKRYIEMPVLLFL